MSQSEEKPQNQAKSNRNNATFFQYPKKKWSYDDDVCTISATLNFFLTEIFYGHMVFQTWVHHPWQSVSKLWMPEDDLLPPLHKQRLCIKNFKALVTDHHTIKAISTSSLSFCKNNNHHEHCHWTVPTPIRFILNLQHIHFKPTTASAKPNRTFSPHNSMSQCGNWCMKVTWGVWVDFSCCDTPMSAHAVWTSLFLALFFLA